MFRELVPQELAKVREILGEKRYAAGKYDEAAKMFEQLTLDETSSISSPCRRTNTSSRTNTVMPVIRDS